MSISSNYSEAYPGCEYSLSQLLCAAKMKLRDTISGGRCVRCRGRGVSDFRQSASFCRVAVTLDQVEVSQDETEPSVRT